MAATEQPLELGEQIVAVQVSDMTQDRRLVANNRRVWVENDSQAPTTP